jgi:hypothetical protein
MPAFIADCDDNFKSEFDCYKYPQRFQEVSGDGFRDNVASLAEIPCTVGLAGQVIYEGLIQMATSIKC